MRRHTADSGSDGRDRSPEGGRASRTSGSSPRCRGEVVSVTGHGRHRRAARSRARAVRVSTHDGRVDRRARRGVRRLHVRACRMVGFAIGRDPETIMTITLGGGGEGPQSGGPHDDGRPCRSRRSAARRAQRGRNRSRACRGGAPEMTVPTPDGEAAKRGVDGRQAGARRGARANADAGRARPQPGALSPSPARAGEGFGLVDRRRSRRRRESRRRRFLLSRLHR